MQQPDLAKLVKDLTHAEGKEEIQQIKEEAGYTYWQQKINQVINEKYRQFKQEKYQAFKQREFTSRKELLSSLIEKTVYYVGPSDSQLTRNTQGVLEKVKRTRCLVKIDDHTWNIPIMQVDQAPTSQRILKFNADGSIENV